VDTSKVNSWSLESVGIATMVAYMLIREGFEGRHLSGYSLSLGFPVANRADVISIYKFGLFLHRILGGRSLEFHRHVS
jgi:hypothetical protein